MGLSLRVIFHLRVGIAECPGSCRRTRDPKNITEGWFARMDAKSKEGGGLWRPDVKTPTPVYNLARTQGRKKKDGLSTRSRSLLQRENVCFFWRKNGEFGSLNHGVCVVCLFMCEHSPASVDRGTSRSPFRCTGERRTEKNVGAHRMVYSKKKEKHTDCGKGCLRTVFFNQSTWRAAREALSAPRTSGCR